MYRYSILDLQNILLSPWSQSAGAVASFLESSLSPWGGNESIRNMAAAARLFEQTTRTARKPVFDLHFTKFRGDAILVREHTVWSTPFCQLLNFARTSLVPSTQEHINRDPKVLIIPPMSGHYATLFRDTVEALLPSHDVYVADWSDAKMVPLTDGYFDLEDQIETIMNMIRELGDNVHVIAAYQASISALCATSLLAQQNDVTPSSLTLLGGAIDASCPVGLLSEMAHKHSLSWYRENQIQLVPPYYPGALRRVYPGLSQIMDRMALSLNREVVAQMKYFQHLTYGDDDTPKNHERFYDEFLTVMDVPEEFYLQLVERIFQRNDLAQKSFTWHGAKVDLSAIEKTALLTVEGELDNLSPPGQTQAALALCPNIPSTKKQAHLEIGAGHYAIFNGRKWRNNVLPIIHKFIRAHTAP